MIRPIDIRLNAAHPDYPLAEAVTFTGAPSTVLIRGVPPNCGRWAITAVFVAATYPDGSTTTRAAVQSANGVWVATLPATARSGRTENGLRVMADGIDENGAAVTGYILGVADFAVASLGVTPAPEPGETSWQMLYFDAVPGTLRKGDVAKVDGVLKFYNGTAWEAFATPPALDDTVTSSSANGVKSSGIWSALWGALAALPTGFTSLYDWCVAQLAGKVPTSRTVNGKALSADVTLDAEDVGALPSTTDGSNQYVNSDVHFIAANGDIWLPLGGTGMLTYLPRSESTTQNNLAAWKEGGGLADSGKKPSDFQPALTAQQLANIAAVPSKANASDLCYAISESIPLTVTSGAAATTLTDRMHNVRTIAAAGSGNTTTITATLPPIVAGKSRDMFLNLTVGTQASDAGDISLPIVEPSGATVQIDIGSVEDIGIGKNEILISENALPTTSGNTTTTHWLVTVRHEDFAS